MFERIITGLLLVVAIIHLLPLSGFFGADRIALLYDVLLPDQNLEILMRHRAMLFGILGVFFVYAAFRPSIQPIAFFAALASISSFFYLAYSIGGFNDSIKKVIIADLVAFIALFGAVVLYLMKDMLMKDMK